MTTDVVSEKDKTVILDQRLSAVFEVARILATEHELDTMLKQFLTCLIEMLEVADAGVVLLYNPSEDHLRVRATYGYELSVLEQINLAPGEATCGKTFQTGETQFYPNAQTIAKARENLTPDNLKALQAATPNQRHPQSAVCIPLFTGQKKVGVLMLENLRQPRDFVDTSLPFLKAVVDLIALAIENARLRRELQAVQALEEANRLKAELISTLAHEMRTPLTSIKGYSTALLMEETSFDPEAQQDFLKIIDEECDTLQDLIHDLLESSIIDAGLLKLEPQPVMMTRLAREVVDDFTHRTDNHRFLVDFPEDFPIVDADPRRIGQVLRNLLDNAVKYSPEGGLVVVRGEIEDNEVIISVADQGIGIAPEHLNHLFEKFFRVESGLGRHVVGSGLGLPIAHTIVESHGGRIWAESQVGEGSTFYFTLPLEGISQGLKEHTEGEAAI